MYGYQARPRPGYIHPDEFFQCVDIAARDVTGADVFVPWEWGGKGALGPVPLIVTYH